MGLDMFLFRITPVEENSDELQINTEIYWRKANHIHRWFVDNVQDGCDNCAYYPVLKDDLAELRDICRSVLSNKSKAEEIMPTQSGFFFGSTDYDEYYFFECERTLKEINRLLNNVDFDLFIYFSSW